MKNLLLFAFVLSTFAACGVAKYPVKTDAAENNAAYTVDYLFEYEGVKIYRFYDRSNYVYFTKPSSTVTAITADSTKHVTLTIQGE